MKCIYKFFHFKVTEERDSKMKTPAHSMIYVKTSGDELKSEHSVKLENH